MNTVVYTSGLSRREKEPPTKLARWVRDVRKQAHLTQDEFAAVLHVHRQTVTSWESGEFEPKRDVLELIMRKYPKTTPPPSTQPTENHTPAQNQQSRASPIEQPAVVARSANVGMLMAAIEKWAADLGIANPIDDSEFAHALSSAWLDHEKRSKPAKTLR